MLIVVVEIKSSYTFIAAYVIHYRKKTPNNNQTYH